jgi:hypothetical protein
MIVDNKPFIVYGLMRKPNPYLHLLICYHILIIQYVWRCIYRVIVQLLLGRVFANSRHIFAVKDPCDNGSTVISLFINERIQQTAKIIAFNEKYFVICEKFSIIAPIVSCQS